ncbi:DUF3231 family protein [Neobacillus sp. SAB-20_R2A]|uniref:DUF3231 family protein n=1 Tax=Neobacillus sp. SAB-20_R2A TaxID=3120519 RepID=UPI003C6EA080
MEFKPTAGEVSNIWRYIIGNQAHLCFLEHWIPHAEDEDLKMILQRSKDLAHQIVNDGSELYVRAGFPQPIGFTIKKDVIPDAPRLMSDKLVLFVLQTLSEYGVYGYGLTIGKTETPEVLAYIKNCLFNSTELYQTITEAIHKKGYQHQPAFIAPPKQSEFVQKQSFLAGWWGEQRPVSAIEIDSLIYSLRGVMLAKIMLIAFSQIAKDPKVQKYCKRGKELAAKRVEKLQSLNATENLPFLATYESEITDSSTSPFSDQLIMFEALSLVEIAISRYGNALSVVARRDLSAMLASYIVETGTFLDDGLSLMIEKKWFEQPPMATERNS